MNCPNCGFENIPGAKFCNECGSKLEAICPRCGTKNPPGSKFCNECGGQFSSSTAPQKAPPQEPSFDEKLSQIQRYLPKGLTEKILAQRGRIEGERKQVTVMFCDMAGYTSLSEKLGPEEAYSVMDRVYEILIHKVHDYEGTVNEMTGDGIMALFGAPLALEDAPQRAIRSAYSIHREMVRFGDEMKKEKPDFPAIRMRVGIHTGPVVVGTLGNDLRVEFKAVGDTVNTASRVEGLAEPGMTYVTEQTFKLTEGLFRFEAQGEKEVKGKSEPIRVYRVIAPRTVRTRFDVSAERGLTPLVGRERDLDILLDGFERCKSGRGQVFSVVGEAGLGKSRLLYEFRKAVTNEDATFLEGNCLSYSRNLAYHPIVDILQSFFNLNEGDRESEIREKVAGGLKVVGLDEKTTGPFILELLSVKDSGIEAVSTNPHARKQEILETVKRILLKSSEKRPLILAVENLHWVDQSSEDALKFVFVGISGAPILMIFTYRPEYTLTWGGRSYHNQMSLYKLSNSESLKLMGNLLGTEDIERDLENLLLEKTEGVPFFIEEFVKSLRDLKVIERVDGGYRMKKGTQTVTIPSEIQDVLTARLDALPEGVKQAAQIGSVIGREFSHDLIAKVTALPESELLARISALKESELVYERGVYPEVTYVFKHALVQDVAYDSLLKNVRQRYHGQVADILEAHFPEIVESQPDLLGYHLTEAGQPERAVTYWQKAGENAIRRAAHVESLVYFDRALESLSALPESLDAFHQEVQIRISVGPILLVTKGYAAQEVKINYSRMIELCDHIGDKQKYCQALAGLSVFHLVRSEYHKSLDICEELLNIAQNENEESLEIWAYRGMGNAHFWLGDFHLSKGHFEQVFKLYNPRKIYNVAYVSGSHVTLHCLLYDALLLEWLGFPDRAVKRSQEALNFANEEFDPFNLAAASIFAANLHYSRRDIKLTQEYAQAAIKLSTDKGFPFWIAVGSILLGWTIALQGNSKDGVLLIHNGLKAHKATGAEQFKPWGKVALAEAYMRGGQIKESLETIEEAIAFIERTNERFIETEVIKLKGELLIAQSSDNQAEAEACFNKAIEIAQGKEAKYFELMATMSLCRLWRNEGKRQAAREKLAEIYGWYTEGFDTPYLQEAKALLDELG